MIKTKISMRLNASEHLKGRYLSRCNVKGSHAYIYYTFSILATNCASKIIHTCSFHKATGAPLGAATCFLTLILHINYQKQLLSFVRL